MTTTADGRAYGAAPSTTVRVVLGFVAGVIGVLIFHQGMLALFHAVGATTIAPYDVTPVPPFAIPAVLSSAFWGGIWGILFATLVWSGRATTRDLLLGLVFGALGPTLVAWFVVAPLKHRPVAAGGVPMLMLGSLLVNGAWGIGTAAALALALRIRPSEHVTSGGTA